MSVLIVYGTTEGHTRKIAEFMGERAGATVVDSAHLPHGLDVASFDRYILAGSLHQEKHQATLEHFAKQNASLLNAKPSMFISSSLSAQGDADDLAGAKKCADKFAEVTGWKPTVIHCVAGALLYTQYDFLKRFLMKMIVKSHNGDTDTSHDYEYTNWDQLARYVDEFMTVS
jgi:menaquinone-dependent protoporphyrinogen oxidase